MRAIKTFKLQTSKSSKLWNCGSDGGLSPITAVLEQIALAFHILEVIAHCHLLSNLSGLKLTWTWSINQYTDCNMDQ